MDTKQDSEQYPKSLIDKVKEILAAQIGVEPDDIHDEDLLAEDLHMSAYDISDFVHSLENNGFNIKDIDLTNLETVSDIVEVLSSSDLIN
jgi:acyl carrier protein